MTPKLTMKETTNVVEAILNSSEPISGTTVRSRPTMPPTKALIRTSRENCGQLARRPRLTLGTPSAADIRGHEARIERPDLRCVRRSRRNVREHRPQKGWLVLYPKCLVVTLLKSNGGCRLTAKAATTHGTGISTRQHL